MSGSESLCPSEVHVSFLMELIPTFSYVSSNSFWKRFKKVLHSPSSPEAEKPHDGIKKLHIVSRRFRATIWTGSAFTQRASTRNFCAISSSATHTHKSSRILRLILSPTSPLL